MNLPEIEIVSAAVHEAWMESKRAQGVTTRLSESREELMVPYQQLSEAAKQLDRGTVQAVYAAIRASAASPSQEADIPARVKRLARGFAQEWLRPSDPDGATPALVDTLQTAMLAFFACASRFKMASSPTVAGWQPIETAPQDGSTVLVWDGHDVMTARNILIGELETGEPVFQWCADQSCAEDPTHWMPLPAPPKDGETHTETP